jgi:hypothetical protein
VLAVATVYGEPGLTKERKVGGNSGLFHPEYFLQLADGNLAFIQQQKNAGAGWVRE